MPCVAAVFANDMYVECAFSMEAAARIRGIKVWLTNEYEHNGIRADGVRLLDRLMGMLHGQV